MPEKEPDLMSQSMYGAFNTPKGESGPFSAKRVVHESDTPHGKAQQGKVIFVTNVMLYISVKYYQLNLSYCV